MKIAWETKGEKCYVKNIKIEIYIAYGDRNGDKELLQIADEKIYEYF